MFRYIYSFHFKIISSVVYLRRIIDLYCIDTRVFGPGSSVVSAGFPFLNVLLGTGCLGVLGAWWVIDGGRIGWGSLLSRRFALVHFFFFSACLCCCPNIFLVYRCGCYIDIVRRKPVSRTLGSLEGKVAKKWALSCACAVHPPCGCGSFWSHYVFHKCNSTHSKKKNCNSTQRWCSSWRH
jgi:hypothetical protein